MQVLTISKNSEIIIPRVELADSYFTRLRGLMFRKVLPHGTGLLIVPCNSIHTFNMKFAIDTVYLDENDTVVRIDESVPKNKVCKTEKQAKKVLELNGGAAAEAGIKTGDKLIINPTEK